MNIRQKIVEIASTAFSVPADQINFRAGWNDQNADSFALVEVLVGVQEEFGIQFQPSELRRLRNLEEMISAVEGKLAAKR